jgi:tetraacyldisaccharide 4'-kinase
VQIPDFWKKSGSAIEWLLLPLGWCYGFIVKSRIFMARPVKATIPVICIGNFVTGGAGKTPVAINLARRLIEKGQNVCFLTRGYGGKLDGPIRVNPKKHTVLEVGDEALLLARIASVWVAKVRSDGVKAASADDEGGFPDVIIMDDGFQNPTVAKDLSFLVVDGGLGFGNGRIFPAGPLRESISSALSRADGIFLIGSDNMGIEKMLAAHGLDIPLIQARSYFGSEAVSLKEKPIVAFAGIAYPEKFFYALHDFGFKVASELSFPDHHIFTKNDLERLRKEAKNYDARLVTTEKDAVRLSPKDLETISVLTMSLGWADERSLDAALNPLFGI